MGVHKILQMFVKSNIFVMLNVFFREDKMTECTFQKKI